VLSNCKKDGQKAARPFAGYLCFFRSLVIKSCMSRSNLRAWRAIQGPIFIHPTIFRFSFVLIHEGFIRFMRFVGQGFND